MSSSLATRVTRNVIFYAAVRLLSGATSFYLFGLIAALYAPSITASCYFFMFILGFLITALRMTGTINAAVDQSRPRTFNLRRIRVALTQAFILATMAAPVSAWLLFPHIEGYWPLVAAIIVLPFASIDTDLLRAPVGKQPQFPAAFALGSTISVLLLLIAPRKTHDLAIYAILMQWMPATFLGAHTLIRLGWSSFKSTCQASSFSTKSLTWIFLISLFDGLVLNSPFFLGAKLLDSTRIDMAVVVRIFSASLLFSPLILFWSNSLVLARVASLIRMSSSDTYLIMQVGLSAASAAAFIVAYTLISGVAMRLEQYLAVSMLLVSYGFYAAAARHHGHRKPSRLQASALAAVLLTTFLTMYWILAIVGVAYFSLLQSTALLLGAWLIKKNAKQQDYG